MPQNRFVVDFVKTYSRPGILLSVAPKLERKVKDNPKSEQVQGVDAEGNPKWVVTVAVPVQGFSGEKFENLSITVASKIQPLANMPPGQYVLPEGLELGIMKQSGDKGGYTVFFSAATIKPVTVQQPPQGQQPSR